MTAEPATLQDFNAGTRDSSLASGLEGEVLRDLITVLGTAMPESQAVALAKKISDKYAAIKPQNEAGNWTGYRATYELQDHVDRQALVNALNPLCVDYLSHPGDPAVTLLASSIREKLAATVGKREAFCTAAKKITGRIATVAAYGAAATFFGVAFSPGLGIDKKPIVMNALEYGFAAATYVLLGAGVSALANGTFRLATRKGRKILKQDTDAQNVCAIKLDYLLSRPDKLAQQAFRINLHNS